MSDSINYGQLMHQALQGLVARVLGDVARNGLPGDHHFFITFSTSAEGLELPDWLREQYPDEMTIVLQEWFANLEVTKDGFSVTLNFGDDQVPMFIPFDAIRTFVDPSVEFGLRFEETDEPTAEETPDEPDTPPEAPEVGGDAEVVSLDHFRK